VRSNWARPARALIVGFLTCASTFALAQNAGPQPHGQVPGPNALPSEKAGQGGPPPAEVQPVPGAMPGSEDVPSTLSEQNARDDTLPIAAFRLKTLTDLQRQAIYRSVLADKRPTPAAVSIRRIEVGMQLPGDVWLAPLPADAAAAAPQAKDLHYHLASGTLVLADPLRRQVFAVIPPP